MNTKKHTGLLMAVRCAIGVFMIISATILMPGAKVSAAKKYYNVIRKLSDTESWDVISGTNVALIADNVTLMKAYKTIKITGKDRSKIQWKNNKGDYTVDIDDMIKAAKDDIGGGSIGYIGALKAGNGNVYSPDATIQMTFKNAAIDFDDVRYDMVLTITGIKIKVKKGSNVKKGVALLHGCNMPDSGLNFSAFNYVGDKKAEFGVSYDANVKLMKSGTDKPIDIENPKMAWNFTDIDIGDTVSDPPREHPYSADYPWAEHVDLKSGFYGDPIYTSVNTELNWSLINNGDGGIRFYHKNKEFDSTNKTKIMFSIDPRGFSYRWTGSRCGTEFIGRPSGAIYTGRTTIHKSLADKISKDNKIDNNLTVTVKGPTQDISFYHEIKRNSYAVGDKRYYEKFYVNVGADSGNHHGSIDAPKGYYFSDDKPHEVRRSGATVTLNPGQFKYIWQTLHFQRSSLSQALGGVAEGECTIMGGTPGKYKGRACVKLQRPVAKFSGSIGAKIIPDGTATYTAPSSGDAGTKVTSSDGAFKIRFTNKIKREKDEAGGKVRTNWQTVQKRGSKNGSEISGSGRSDKTSALEINEEQTVVKETNNYIYEGKLEYGETQIICDVLTWDSVINASAGNTVGSTSKCIKVYREKAKCGLDTAYGYGVNDGRNISRIGVVNRSIVGSDGSFVFTNHNPTSFTSENNYTNEVSVWARPGDSIRFRYEDCDGAAYAVSNTSSLDNFTYRTIHTAEGKSSISGRTGYLFGASVPDTISSSPLKYSDTRIRDSSATNNGSLYDYSDAEHNFLSPSNTNVDTYNVNTYNKETYKCKNLNESNFYTEHYQIAGTNSESGCNSASKTSHGGNDVGSTITQTSTWNDLNIVKGAVSGTARIFTAKANVHIPYNYKLEPYAKRNSASIDNNVVYGGSSFTVSTGVYVQPRTNTSISNDSSNNKYATITKPSRIRIEKYYTTIDASGNISSTESELTQLLEKDNITFNNDGNINGLTTGDGDAYPESGYSIYVPNNRPVGSVVCVKYSVYPRDSHNDLSATSGAGKNNIALSRSAGGDDASWATARACYVVAKRPTTSFEGSNALAAGPNGFTTSRYTRSSTENATGNLFGSWSEYALVGKNTANSVRYGTASGASFGYAVGNSGVAINDGRENSGDIATQSKAGNVCVFGSQTFSNNVSCGDESSSLGSSEIASAASSAKNFATSIKSRYAANAATKIIKVSNLGECSSFDSPGAAHCVTDNEGTKYAHISVSNGLLAGSGAGGVLYNRIEGNAYLGSVPVAPEQATVYYVTGTLVINGDILTSSSDAGYNSINAIRQNLIFADKVLIMPNVKKIDALVVADSEVDTCAYTSIDNLKNGVRTRLNSLSSQVCNNELIFEAPVITPAIKLHRTYGADEGNNAIRRAEVFNFNMANYLWSYSQSAKYNQANTTNIRELPPRY